MAVNEEWMILAGSPVFKELPRDALEAIAGVVQPLTVPAKTIIFKEGDPGDRLYIVPFRIGADLQEKSGRNRVRHFHQEFRRYLW